MESISAIENSLDDLEHVLKPLFETDLSETLTKLDTIQRAKLQVTLPYVVHNLVISYLRMRDIDPADHAVASELERIGQYFSKIKNAENPEKRTLVVDQEAATRFIKHAIKEAGSDRTQGTHIRFTDTTEVSTSTTTTTTQTTTQAAVAGAQPTAAALAKIEERKKALATNDHSEPLDDELMMVGDETVVSKVEGKRKAREDNISTTNDNSNKNSGVNLKKRRKAMDPWTGFDDSTPSTSTQPADDTATLQNAQTNDTHDVDVASAAKPRKPRTKKKKPMPKDVEVIDVDAESGSNAENVQRIANLKAQETTIQVDSSRSDTPVQGKSKKNRKRKKEPKEDQVPINISSDSAG